MRRSTSTVLATLVLCLFSLGGCASGGIYGEKYSDLVSRIPPIPQGHGRIYFYRMSAFLFGRSRSRMLEPQIFLNSVRVGASHADGFFFVDRPPGQYEAICDTEVIRRISFELKSNQTQYIRAEMYAGVFLNRVALLHESESKALNDMAQTRYIGDSYIAKLKP